MRTGLRTGLRTGGDPGGAGSAGDHHEGEDGCLPPTKGLEWEGIRGPLRGLGRPGLR